MRETDSPRPAALLLGLLAWALFTWRIAIPHVLVFDEIHYVPAARTLLSLSGPRNIEHPMLGKELIALGMLLFGDNALGWRMLSALAGVVTVVSTYAALWLLFRSVRTALTGGLLVLLNFTVFVQARIAMLDGFMAAFLLAAFATMLWAMRSEVRQVRRRWAGASVLMGLAVACKWAAAPYVAFAAVAFVVVRRGKAERWPGLGAIRGCAILGIVSVVTYLLTFLPAFFYASDPLTLPSLLPFQLRMLHQQEMVLTPHVYQSDWQSWALMIRPIWYLYERVDGAQRGILFIGNPAIMWGGLFAVAACVHAWGRRGDAKAGSLAAIWACSYLVWAIVPKSPSFFYYYYLSSIWIALVIAAAFHHWRAGLRDWDQAFLLAAAVLFVFFYPILGATPLSGERTFHRWMWLHSWI